MVELNFLQRLEEKCEMVLLGTRIELAPYVYIPDFSDQSVYRLRYPSKSKIHNSSIKNRFSSTRNFFYFSIPQVDLILPIE